MVAEESGRRTLSTEKRRRKEGRGMEGRNGRAVAFNRRTADLLLLPYRTPGFGETGRLLIPIVTSRQLYLSLFLPVLLLPPIEAIPPC